MQIMKTYKTETSHRLHPYNGRCSHLHGHSYVYHIYVEGPVDIKGMVLDFGDLKTQVLDLILDKYDHALILSSHDPQLDVLRQLYGTNGEPLRLIVYPDSPTAENMAKIIGPQLDAALKEYLGPDYCVSQLWIWETPTATAIWHNPEVI